MTSSRRNNEIECLRAIAVLGVAVHHMQGNLFKNSLPFLDAMFKRCDFWFGVDLFFAISGFVIARGLLPELTVFNGTLRQQARIIVAFWIRRAWRLLPSAWLWLGFTLLAVLAFNDSGAFGHVRPNLMATLAGMLNVANFRFASTIFHREYGASFVYWSLSLEEQFYLLLPLLVLCLRRRIDVFMAGLVVAQFSLIRMPPLMAFRTDALAWGVLLACMTRSATYIAIEPRYLLRLGPLRLIVPALLLAVLALLAAPFTAVWHTRIGLIAVLSATLVWIASYDRGYLFPRNGASRLLAWIGARSYAIYLIHIPTFFFMREIYDRLEIPSPATWLSAIPLCTFAVGLSVLLAELNYRYIEQPLRRRGIRIAEHFLNHQLRDEPQGSSTLMQLTTDMGPDRLSSPVTQD
ncbi:acyltransferase family protein [Dyella flava]|uniref:Acyltransferase n=1 Tax=Dyella flava TaxID=1920170 RepID=A0ABS2K026_9GAMM|nr:acyltransferase [Dyella flava]MBM7124605.1 acyltransferase [Dyella flava]GLQ49258.1 acyltransferase [Dyella flava]